MIVNLSAAAETEMEEAYDYYEAQRGGLGDEFAVELEGAFRELARSPLRWPEVETGFRKYRLNRFPYLLFYRVVSGHVQVISVSHAARKPGHWRPHLD
jgi:toxin ParE1/3/4